MLRGGGGGGGGEGYANHSLIFQPGMMVNQQQQGQQQQAATSMSMQQAQAMHQHDNGGASVNMTAAVNSNIPGGGGGGGPSSRYESQKRRDWNTFGQYLRNHRPPLVLAKCSGAHVLEFLRYLDQFGKTKVHVQGCPYYGHPQPPAACSCPLRQAWGSLDALIGRLRAAFEEHGGKPESNPFGARAVRIYLREVREMQAKARGIAYEKKKRKKPPPAAVQSTTIISNNITCSTTTSSTTTTNSSCNTAAPILNTAASNFNVSPNSTISSSNNYILQSPNNSSSSSSSNSTSHNLQQQPHLLHIPHFLPHQSFHN